MSVFNFELISLNKILLLKSLLNLQLNELFKHEPAIAYNKSENFWLLCSIDGSFLETRELQLRLQCVIQSQVQSLALLLMVGSPSLHLLHRVLPLTNNNIRLNKISFDANKTNFNFISQTTGGLLQCFTHVVTIK